ncbi:Uncharacterised protein [Chryseobacterium nakagawai]|uniref:Lipoprotein n=1 Tax=Chryseobacterium nakagawai TaxID=1241982 RepID=A0AAD0YFB9_CHRNA|nr:hypothetical protein [Chryseobacterium nakagawai]AZA89981.1 hypothetical protein EG343_04740 [Chryseobacterium nakagawai]VEH21405.1 Uncharacterised protein [Chryseobacterium nakagawai]
MKNIFIILTLITTVYSCQQDKKGYKLKKSSIKNVSFEMPVGFLLKKTNSEDAEIYDILSNKKSIGTVYLGSYYKPFVEDYSITEEKEVYRRVGSKGARIYYTPNLDIDYKNGVFNDNYYYYDTINRNIAQVMLPKKPNKGLVGIYFDSVDIHKNKFAIISNNLSDENKKIFLEIFKTIKITKATQ